MSAIAMTVRRSLFGLDVDVVTLSDAVARTLELARTVAPPCPYVVTPNLDHVMIYQENPTLRRAYAASTLVIADGAPLVWASRLFGRPLPERVAGSDLVPAVLAAASPSAPLTVFLLGAAPGVADRAAANIERQYRGVRVVGTHSPPLGFESVPQEKQRAVDLVNAAKPNVLLVGLGAPKQETFVFDHREQLQAGVALCIGATIDFLAGHRKRAPVWMQRSGLEFVHRAASEPRRLVPRYARNAVGFPVLLWRELRREARSRLGAS